MGYSKIMNSTMLSKQNTKEFNQKIKLENLQHVKLNDDREEGEIIDDYELILSSEEEYSVRERIRELEATNNEIEQIAEISGSYANNYNYCFGLNCHQEYQPYKHLKRNISVLSDIASLSSDDFYVAKKKRHKTKKTRSKRLEQSGLGKKDISTKHGKKRIHHTHRSSDSKKPHRSVCVRREKRSRESNLSDSLNDDDDQDVLMNNRGGFKKWVRDDDDDDEYNDDTDDCIINGINREKLRFALAHDKKRDMPMGSLKERLENKLNCLKASDTQVKLPDQEQETKEQQNQNAFLPYDFERNGDSSDKGVIIDCDSNTNSISYCNSNNEDSVEESELRLIALKSAVMNKHNLRKKRNAEMAYSPTDFIDNHEFKNIDDCDIDDIMEISPAESPSIEIRDPLDESSVNMKPVDMDIVTSDDSDSGERTQHNFYNGKLEFQWSHQSINNNSYTNNIKINNLDLLLPCGAYFPELKQPSNQSEIVELQDEDEVPPPPPPFFISNEHLSDVDNENTKKPCLNIDTSNQNHQHRQQNLIVKTEDPAMLPIINTMDLTETSDDEEEKALRALLLSNHKFVKRGDDNEVVHKESHSETQVPHSPTNLISDSVNKKIINDINEDTEELRSLLLLSMKYKSKNHTRGHENQSSPNVLKEALLRFQDNSINILSHNIPIANREGEEKEEDKSSEESKSLPMDIEKMDSNDIDTTTNEKNSTPVVWTCKENINGNLKNSTCRSLGNADGNIRVVINCKKTEVINENEENKNSISQQKAETRFVSLDITSPTTTTAARFDSKTKPIACLQRVVTRPLKATLNQSQQMKSTLKIVKPNKVINKKSEQQQQQPSKEETAGKTNFNRLLTKADLTKFKVKRMVISLSNLTSESEDSYFSDSRSEEQNIATDSLAALTYSDNVSPISLPMESPCGTPPRSNTPCIENATAETTSTSGNLRKTVMNEFFERKLDDFLKQARFNVENAIPAEIVKNIPSSSSSSRNGNGKENSDLNRKSASSGNGIVTPLSVRHLPAASQQEYRILVERMKLLERRKELRTLNVAHANRRLNLSPKEVIADMPDQKKNSSSCQVTRIINDRTKILQQQQDQEQEGQERRTPPKRVVTKKIISKNLKTQPVIGHPEQPLPTKNTSSRSSVIAEKQNNSSIKNLVSSKNEKKNRLNDQSMVVVNQPTTITNNGRLHDLESSYTSVGTEIITQLNKTLIMVEEAKSSKIAKLRLDKRLKELQNEVNEVMLKLNNEKLKISKIQPHIQQCNKLLSQLKMRRSKLYDAAMYLGKTQNNNTSNITTEEYRYFTQAIEQIAFRMDLEKFLLYDAATAEINEKTKKLSKQIHLLNALKTFGDIGTIEEKEAQDEERRAEAGNNGNKEIEIETNANENSEIQMRIRNGDMVVHFNENCNKMKKRNTQETLDNSNQEEKPQKQNEEESELISNSGKACNEKKNDDPVSNAISNKDCNANNNILDVNSNVHISPNESLPKNLTNKTNKNNNINDNKNQQKETLLSYTESIYKTLVNQQQQPLKDYQKRHADYVSPLQFHQFASVSSLNCDRLVCPYDLMGNCEDTACPFLHL